MTDLEKLKDDDHYYGEFGKNFLSNSDIITLLNDPKTFRKPKDFTKPMLIGRYYQSSYEEAKICYLFEQRIFSLAV